MVYKFFDKKISGSAFKREIMKNEELAEELQNPIIQIFQKKSTLIFIDNIWDAYLADIQLISRSNKGFRFLLCVNDIYSKYAWLIPLQHKKCITIANAF